MIIHVFLWGFGSMRACLITALFPFFSCSADSCLLRALSADSTPAMCTEMSCLIVSDNAPCMRNTEHEGVFFNLLQLRRTVDDATHILRV